MNRILLLASFLLTGFLAAAQTGTVSGRVIDAETLEVLPFANVFVNNSTLGASTSEKGEFLIKNVPVGSPEIVFSFIGYQPYQLRVNVRDGEDTRLNIKLTPLKNQLDEIQVKGTRDKSWEKKMKRFEKIFLGSDDLGRQCKIANPASIDFPETKDGKFIAEASEPIVVFNDALGYKVSFYLKSFRADEATYAIVGNARFEELDAKNSEDALRWTTNRKEAYLGSARHLFRSIMTNKLSEEGFRVYVSHGAATLTSRGKVFANELGQTMTPLRLDGVVNPGSTNFEKRLALGPMIEVHYINDATQRQAYSDIAHAVSWLEMKGGIVRVTTEGIPLNPTEVIFSGDMGLARVSNMLPLDYEPQGVVRVKSARQVEVLKMYEKVYIQTSKPFYYPGEIIWMKAYMNYGAREMRDTLSTLLHVDLINEDRVVVMSRNLRIENTIASGNFMLPEKLRPGKYGIIAYTNWMRNFGSKTYFTKVIPILSEYEKISEAGEAKVRSSRELEVVFDKPKYGPRELVTATLALTDEAEKPVGGNFSVSVTDLKQVPVPNWVREDIVTGMSIPPNVELPDNKFNHRVEYGITWAGEFVPDLKKRQKTELTIVQGAFEKVNKITTEDDGSFVLTDLEIYDSVLFSFQALQKGKPYGVVIPKRRDIPFTDFNAANFTIPIERKQSIQRIISPYEIPKGAYLLDEVTVTASKLEDRPKIARNLYGRGDVVIEGDLLRQFGSMEAVLRAKAKGFRLAFDGTHYQLIHIRGEATLPPKALEQLVVQDPDNNKRDGAGITPTFRVDRTPEPMLAIDNIVQNISSGETVGDRLIYMDLSMIDRIEISSVGSSYMGSQGGYGVVSVFKRQGAPPDKSKFQGIQIKGYDLPDEFRGPDYADTAEDHTQSDFRSTLYWNKNVQIPRDGEGKFSFYTSDLGGTYRIVIEGVNFEGKPIHVEKLIEVEGN